MQPLNAAFPIDVTLLGIVTDVNEVQSENTPGPIDVTLLGMVTDVNEVQL